MDFDIMKASRGLSELDLKINTGNLGINVLWFRAMQCNMDDVIERHMHSTFEFHFVYAGSSRVELDDGGFDIQAGEFYLARPGVYHRQHNFKGYIEFSLNCELSSDEEQESEAEYIVDTLKNTGCKPYADVAGATNIFYKALEEAHYKNAGFYNNIRSLTIMLITAAARAIDGLTPARYTVPIKHKKIEYRFMQISDYIRDNISLPISTTDISHYMFLGEKQISRIVSEAAGMTTKELIQEFKFQKAKSMLIERQDLTIRQIAEMLGFSSEYYFNQFFKRKEGYPPGVFRVNVR
jgi:AraC-like DNA-binding protein